MFLSPSEILLFESSISDEIPSVKSIRTLIAVVILVFTGSCVVEIVFTVVSGNSCPTLAVVTSATSSSVSCFASIISISSVSLRIS